MAALVRSLAAEGIAVLLVEHDMAFVMGVSQAITVLNFGSVLAQGTPQQIAGNQEVIDAYIGTWDEEPTRRNPPIRQSRFEAGGDTWHV